MLRLLSLLALIAAPAFAQSVPISALPSASTPLSGSELTVVVQSNTTKKTTVSSFAAPVLTIPGNSLLGNATAVSGVATGLSVPSCSTASSALSWTTNTGLGCNTAINAATLSGLSGTSAAVASTVLFRDANANAFANNFIGNSTSTAAAAGTTTLTAGSTTTQILTTSGGNGQTYQLPDATTLSIGPWFLFNNNAAGSLTINNAGGSLVYTTPPGGITQCGPTSIGTANGTWDCHSWIPLNATWGTSGGIVMNTSLSTTPQVSNGVASSTNPVFIPQRGTSNTGYSGDATHLYTIVGGSTIGTWTSGGLNAVIGDTTPAAGTFTTLTATGTTTVKNLKMLGSASGSFAAGEWSRDTNWGTYFKSPAATAIADLALFDSTAATGAFLTSGAVYFGGTAPTASSLEVDTTASANRRVTIAGSNGGSPTIGTTAAALALAPSNNQVTIQGTTQPTLQFYIGSLGTDLKNWDWYANGGISLRAVNDAYGAATTAYTVSRGTTYNVASHTWYTSTVAGTPVQGMQLTTTGLTLAQPLPFGSGGTGQTSYTDGQLLIGNTATGGLSKATLTAGANVTITNGNGSIQIAATSAAYLTWQGVKNASFNAAAGNIYCVDTSGGAVTATLPASPNAGDTIKFLDCKRTWGTNALTLGRNTKSIAGQAADFDFNASGAVPNTIYYDSTNSNWVLG